MEGLVKLVTAMKGDEITAPRKTTRRNRTFLKLTSKLVVGFVFVPNLTVKT